MRRVAALAGLALVGIAVACSSFSDDSAPAGDDGGAPDASPVDGSTPVADAGDLDANPCRLGNGKHDGSFCDDFDDRDDLGRWWLDIFAPPDGGIAIQANDAAQSPPKVLASFIPADGGQVKTTANMPLKDAKKVDCSFSVNTYKLDPADSIALFYVDVIEASPARRAFALSVNGTNGHAIVQSGLFVDGGEDVDEAGVAATGVKMTPGWRRVRVAMEKGKPVIIDVGGLYTFTGPVLTDVKLGHFLLGVSSPQSMTGVAAALFDDVVCTYE